MCLRNPDNVVTVFCDVGAIDWPGAETRTGMVPQPGYIACTGGFRAVDGREPFSAQYVGSGGVAS